MALEDAASEVDVALTGREKGLAYENAFSGATSFLRRRYAKDLAGVDLAITGIPFDQAVTNRPGCRLGPRAIREASSLLPFDPPYGWGYDPLSALSIADAGDMAFDYARPAEVPERIEAHAAAILGQGAALVTLGGDHSISLPLLRAHAARHGPLSLLQFDAHSDTWADDDASRVDHGTMFYKAVKEGVIAPETSAQVGIRTTNPDTLGIAQIDARSVHLDGPVAVAERIRGIVGDQPGLSLLRYRRARPLGGPGHRHAGLGRPLERAGRDHPARHSRASNLVGGDVVEVSPPFDTTGATAIAGAHVALEIILPLGLDETAGVRRRT